MHTEKAKPYACATTKPVTVVHANFLIATIMTGKGTSDKQKNFRMQTLSVKITHHFHITSQTLHLAEKMAAQDS